MTYTMSVGNSFRLDLSVTDSAGAVKDISGATLSIKAYDKPLGEVILTGTAAVTDGPNGLAVASFSVAQNIVTEFAVLHLVVKLTESGGAATDLVSDKLVVS